jgi:hypothetical protein
VAPEIQPIWTARACDPDSAMKTHPAMFKAPGLIKPLTEKPLQRDCGPAPSMPSGTMVW